MAILIVLLSVATAQTAEFKASLSKEQIRAFMHTDSTGERNIFRASEDAL